MTICQHLAITPDELAAIGFIHERMLGFPTGRANPPQGRARATPSAQPCVAHDRTPVGAVARGRIGCGQKLSQFTPVRCRLPGAGEARNSYSRSCADVAEYPSTQLESGLGLRPHEFESRILRHLTRGNAPPLRLAEGVFSSFGQNIGQLRRGFGSSSLDADGRWRTPASDSGCQCASQDGTARR